MSDDMIALSRRAVACKGWRWMPGMKVDGGFRVVESLVPFTFPVDLPDLSDPATLGCLLAIVREAWGDPRASTNASPYGDGRWAVSDSKARRAYAWGTSEADALVAALESAP